MSMMAIPSLPTRLSYSLRRRDIHYGWVVLVATLSLARCENSLAVRL